jgi:hypothetical protein
MKTNWDNTQLGDLEDYSNASGGRLCFLKSGSKKEECLEAQAERKSSKPKSLEAQAELELAKAISEKAGQKEEGMSAMAITGIIVGSLMAITVMVVVIKKVKAKRG